MTRITEDTVVLSSEVSDIDAEELSDTASDKSSNISDLEFQSFSSQKIVKEKITEIEEDNDVPSSSSESVTFKNNKSKKSNKRKATLSLSDKAENLNPVQRTKLHNNCIENNECTQVIANACYEQVKVLIQKKMDNIKKSILYDIRKGFEELQNNLLLNLSHKDEMNPVSALKQIIGFTLPISILDDFDTLDASMDVDEKKNALRTLFEKYVDVASTHRKAIHNALSAVMTKDVQILFTAFGRQKNETKKLNFSKTKIYSLLMDILVSKFGTKEEREINSSLSRWFSGAVDRCGGRKERENVGKNVN
ncbi:uncharacterized protein [Linepithema humile]|uniref:uncharacterized protein n=1 Tax=Linepithema humile TaxID=83485 RepID=UPI00351DD4D0